MFVSLGLKNAWRNRGRTALGIISMAVAAVIFMSSSTLSKGYPAGAFWEARQLIGGEILMLPERIALSTDALSAGGYTWEFETRSYDRPNLTMGFDPTAYWYGGMRGLPSPGQSTISPDRLDEIADELQENPSVAGASVRRALPFLVQTGDSKSMFYMYGFIEPRDIALDTDTYKMSEAMARGRYLEPDDLMKGVACAGWRNLTLGLKADLEIPRLRADGPSGAVENANPHFAGFDYERHVAATIDIVGQASFAEGSPGGPTYANPVLFVTPETFDALKSASGIPDSLTNWGISVTVDNMADLENYVGLLRRQYPDLTVYSVSQLSTASANRDTMATGVPMDMRRVTEALSFMIAALLSATNLSVLMLARKNEIGILRAIGATRWNITCMVLAESIWVAFLGSLIGGLFTQPAILWQFLSNNIEFRIVAETIGANLGRALGFSVAAAVLFGFLPVAKALRVTPAQVLRGE